MLVGAGILSTNVVSVLGESRAGFDMLARPRTIPAKNSVRTEHLHERVPVILPVPNSDDLLGGTTARVTEPLPQRFYEPGSHISPRVRWKLSQLRNANRASKGSGDRIALAHQAAQPERLNALAAVFRPTHIEPARMATPLDEFWEVEKLYVEAAPAPPLEVGSAPIPEPSTGVLMSLGLFAMAARRRSLPRNR